MQLTITAKLKISPTQLQQYSIKDTLSVIKNGLNAVSAIVFDTKQLSQIKLHSMTYRMLRVEHSLRSQMSQSIMKTVIAKYRSERANGHPWSKVRFKKPEYDLVWNRDYSLKKDNFSVNTLEGRIVVPFEKQQMEHYFDGTWSFGTAKLVHKKGKFFLHIPMSKEVEQPVLDQICNVVGVDVGMNFIAATYDSKDKTTFYSGRFIKDKRAKYAKVRKSLQMRQTPSARRRLKAIGSRENRWMTDVNHCVSKALVEQAGERALFVLEDLFGIRWTAERVCLKDRHVTVSWAYYQLQQFIEYKALKNNSRTIYKNPKYTSQKCPKCGHTHKGNRNRKTHTFCCQNCGFTTNDDRVSAINLRVLGSEYIHEELVGASSYQPGSCQSAQMYQHA